MPQHSVARGVQFSPAEPCQLLADDGIEALDQFLPSPVSEFGGPLGGTHDVDEEHGCQYTVGLQIRARAGEELLDLLDDRVLIADPGEVVLPGQLNVLRAGNALRGVAAALDTADAVARAVHDEGGNPDGR